MTTDLLIDDSEFLTPLYTSVAEVTQKWEEAKHRRDRQGKFTESATITVGDRQITVVKPERAGSDKLVHIDVAAFDANFSKSPSFYVGPGGQGGISDRYDKFGQYIAEHDSIKASEVTVRSDGVVDFSNGRHRYAWLRDHGVTSIPMAMDEESVKYAKKYGYLSTKKWDESKHPRDKDGQFTEPVTTVHGPGSSVQLPGRYDYTKLPPNSFAITTEHGYILATRSSSDPDYYWVNHIRVSDQHQGKGEGSALFRAAAAESVRQGHKGLMRGDIPDRPASDSAQAVWAKLKNTSTYTDSTGFVHHVLKQEHEYGSTQIEIDPHSSAAASLNTARDTIREADLMANGKDVDGNHVTVRYGLENSDVDALRSFLAAQSPFEAQVIGVELFPASEHSDGAVPVVARIASPELRAIEQEIGDHADFKEKSFPDYKPHATLAYVKPGAAPSYAGLFVHGSFVVQGITISHASGVKETIPFGMANKWDPKQPRDENGRFTDLGLHDGQVTVLHGTTRQNAEAILTEGFKPGNPASVAAQVEQEYGLPQGSILNHVAFQFAKGRKDLENVHFTTDESVADQYSVPEVMQDALTSAHMLLHPTPEDVPFTKSLHAARKAWIDREAKRLTKPALLAVTVPFDVVGQHGFGKQFTLEEFKALLTRFPKSEEDIFNNITLPIAALTGARIERRKWDVVTKRVGSVAHGRRHWDPAKHPHQPKGSSHGGEFMETLHGPRDALDSLLNKEKNVSIQRGDVRAFLEMAGEQHEDPDLTDLHVEGMEIFGGNGLGIDRKRMPQIPREHRDSFLLYMGRHGVHITEEKVDPLTLKPTQDAISARRVAEKLKKYEKGGKKFPPVLITQEDRILDGHHHWGMMAAFSLEVPDVKMPVFRFHVLVERALALMHNYMKIHGLKRADLSGAAVKADPESGRYVTPFVSFDKQGDDQLRMIASLNSSRLATWGFTAEAEVLGMARYKLTAVLDGRTSKFCRMIDGKVFEVPEARRKVIEALNVQDPEDLKVVQPWPRQDKASMAAFEKMSPAELTGLGLHIPPFHPYCRTICRVVQSSAGKVKESVPTLPADTQVFQPITMADLKELGVDATQENVDQWNENISMTPTELLSKLTGMPPQEVLTKGQGVGANPIQFDPTGNIGIRARGVTTGVEFKLGAILDPFTNIFYLTQADLLAGTPAAEASFLKQMFSSLIDMGLKSSAESVAVGVAGNAAYYAKLGFLPDDLEWDSLRRFSLYEIEGGTLKPVLESLAPEDRLLVEHLLQDGSPSALSALVELPFTYEGRTVGEWILSEIQGTWSLDLTDDVLVEQAKAYLS